MGSKLPVVHQESDLRAAKRRSVVRQGSYLPKPMVRILDLSSNKNSESNNILNESKIVKSKFIPSRQKSKFSSSYQHTVSSEEAEERKESNTKRSMESMSNKSEIGESVDIGKSVINI